MAYGTITGGYSISGGLILDLYRTITMGYGLGAITPPLYFLNIGGTVYRELLMTGTVYLELDIDGMVNNSMEL